MSGKHAVHGVDNVGTIPAALAAYLAVQAFTPDLVISAGTAGGFRSQVSVIWRPFASRHTWCFSQCEIQADKELSVYLRLQPA